MPAPESAVLSRIAAVGRRSVGWRALRVLLLTLLTAVALTTPAHAKKKGNWGEASAKRLIKKAMNEDYFDTYYDEAEKKLKRAVQICRDKGCRKKLQARIWQYLGAVYANGLDDVDSASAAFLKMLMLNKQLKPDRKFRSDATDEAFETAREQYNEIAKVELEARKKRIEAEEAEKKRKAAEKAARDKARREKKAAAKRKKELARLKREEEKRAADEKQAAIDAEKARIKAEKKEAARVKRCEIDVPLDLIAAPWVEQAVGYPLLSAAIQAGCRLAIKISEKV